MTKISETISDAKIERQVEDAYNKALESAFPGISMSYPYACDGYFETDVGDRQLRAICEFKYDMNLSSKVERSKILAQVLFYLKRFESDGKPLPNVIFVGDKNECFCLHSNCLVKFLDFEGVDWKKAPSSASENGELVAALATDEERNAYVWDVNESFDFDAVKNQMTSFASGVTRQLHVTEHNVDKIFKMFCSRIVKNSSKIPPNDLVGLFYGCVCDPDGNYLHPTKKNTLVSGAKTFQVDGSAFKAFRQLFEYVKSPSQKKHLASISDRLIEDTNRRRKGEFYTPTPFVDYAHKFTSARLGEDWKERSVVWDCCCGTKNLTRDYQFGELYCSTLEQAELDISKKYNPEAVSFQFDFLNDSLEKLPEGLKKALAEKKEITFLMNPPYGTAGEMGKNKNKTGIAVNTMIHDLMKNEKFGNASEQLFAQFLYRIMMIKKQFGCKVNIAMFCKPVFLTGLAYKKFREILLNEFDYEGGFLFNAGHFADCSANWGIDFTVWKGKQAKSDGNLEHNNDMSNFEHTLINLNDDNDIVEVGMKSLYNLDNIITLGVWCREGVNGKNTSFIPVSSAIKISTAVSGGDTWKEQSLAWFACNGNNIRNNAQGVGLFSAPFLPKKSAGTSVLSANFLRCCSAFAARRLIKGDWINDKDEYMKPNTDDSRYAEFEADSLVFCLFDSNSQQSSLRKVEYKDKAWDVKNEFFWIPSKTMAEWADAEGLDETYAEASVSPDRHMAKVLNETSLSAEAKAVLDKATELVQKSMKFRQMFNDDHPEYQVLNFDSSYYQLKPIWKEYMPKEFKIFRELVKKLADKMRPAVYSLGFLRK